jgi:hypothetical protein
VIEAQKNIRLSDEKRSLISQHVLIKYTSLYEATTAFVSPLSSNIPKAPYVFSNKVRDDYTRNFGTRCCTVSINSPAFAFVFSDETNHRMGYLLFCDVTRFDLWLVANVSRQLISSIFKGQAVKEEMDWLNFEDR